MGFSEMPSGVETTVALGTLRGLGQAHANWKWESNHGAHGHRLAP